MAAVSVLDSAKRNGGGDMVRNNAPVADQKRNSDERGFSRLVLFGLHHDWPVPFGSRPLRFNSALSFLTSETLMPGHFFFQR